MKRLKPDLGCCTTEKRKEFVLGGPNDKQWWYYFHTEQYQTTCLYWIPTTPQATPTPELPVFRLSSVPPLPRSSVPLCTTRARPMMLCSPSSEILLSVKLKLATPLESATMLPRSPIWRSMSMGLPWCLCEEKRHGDFTISSATAYCCKWEQSSSTRPHEHYYAGRVGYKTYTEQRTLLSWVTFRVSFPCACTDASAVQRCVMAGPTWRKLRMSLQSQYAPSEP